MFLKRENGEKIKIQRTKGLSSVSVSPTDAKKDHEKLVDFFSRTLYDVEGEFTNMNFKIVKFDNTHYRIEVGRDSININIEDLSEFIKILQEIRDDQ